MTRTVAILVLLAAFFVGGCRKAQQVDEINYGLEADKAALLKKIERKYEDPEAHYQLAKLYHRDGLYDKADFHYRVAIGFDPVHYRTQAARVKLLVDQRDLAKSGVMAEMYMSQASVSAEASLRLGRGFQDEGLDDYAIACYNQAANLAPNSAVIFKQLGYFYMAKGDMVQAESNLRRSFQLDPYQSEVAGELGRMGIPVQIPREKADNKKLEKAVEE